MLHDVASFLRWNLKPNRWAVKGINTLRDLPSRMSENVAPSPPSPLLDMLVSDGYGKLPRTIAVPEIDVSPYAGQARNKPFVDITADYPDVVEKAFVDILADPETAAMIHGYFEGRPWLWNVALNYSEPREGLTDSQLWHFDYGDQRQLHLMAYFSDVGEASGPFTFLRMEDSQRVARHPFVIERMTDDDLANRFGIDAKAGTVRLTGKNGDLFVNDPGRLMHQGARCSTTRLVMFVTFTSRAPMSSGGGRTIAPAARKRLGAAYRQACPDGLLAPEVFG